MKFTGILIRAVCLVALMEGTAYLFGRVTGQPGDANIGAGIVAFLVVLAGSGAWAFADGRRGPGVGGLLVSWLVVAILVGVAAVLFISLQEEDFDLDVLRSDLVYVSTSIGGIVMFPAAIGVLIGSSSSRDQS